MAIKRPKTEEKKTEEKKTEELIDHDIKIDRANDIEKCIMFDMTVNGIKIYGCSYRTLQRHDGTGEFAKIGFPSRKGSDGHYYANAWFKISDKDLESIEKGIESLLNG